VELYSYTLAVKSKPHMFKMSFVYSSQLVHNIIIVTSGNHSTVYIIVIYTPQLLLLYYNTMLCVWCVSKRRYPIQVPTLFEEINVLMAHGASSSHSRRHSVYTQDVNIVSNVIIYRFVTISFSLVY